MLQLALLRQLPPSYTRSHTMHTIISPMPSAAEAGEVLPHKSTMQLLAVALPHRWALQQGSTDSRPLLGTPASAAAAAAIATATAAAAAATLAVLAAAAAAAAPSGPR
jgi:hypothetical protein